MTPIALLALTQLLTLTADRAQANICRRRISTLIGILAMRWNVVIGGQLFSKSFLGYTTYKMGFATREGPAASGRTHDSSIPDFVGSG